jgi:hypothetical protein
MCFLFHWWAWGDVHWLGTQCVQYATCTRCGKVKVREVLL